MISQRAHILPNFRSQLKSSREDLRCFWECFVEERSEMLGVWWEDSASGKQIHGVRVSDETGQEE
jgi:hypothetical protein